MKKFLTALTACAVLALAMCSLSLAYDNTNADWGVKIDIQKDGSVNISYDAEKVNGTKDGWNAINAHMAIYDADPGFTADSKMADFEGGEQKHYPYTDAVAGNGNAGRVDESNTYNIKKGALNTQTATYPFEEGKTYYVYVCTSDGADWYWNYKPTTFTYSTSSEQPPADTGDFSLIAYAFAAAACSGALALRKKK